VEKRGVIGKTGKREGQYPEE